MTDSIFDTLTLLAALGCGLVGGVFFAFSTFVMAALARLPPAQGIAAMQSINVVVINRYFLGAFFGTAVLCIVVAAAALFARDARGSLGMIVGSILYLGGTIAVTMFCNVPRNNALAGVASDSADGQQLWSRYVLEWTRWNHVRTVAALLAAALLMISLM